MNRILQRLFFVALIALITISINSQVTETVREHSITFSAGSYLLGDAHLSVLSEKINSTSVAWSYSTNNTDQKKSITASYEEGKGIYKMNDIRVKGFLLEYKNAFSIFKSKDQHLNNYTGYSIKTSSQFIRSGDQHSWAGITSLSLYNSLTYCRGNNRFTFDFSIPVTGFASRPEPEKEYKGSVNEMFYNTLSKPGFTSFHNTKELNLSLQYRKILSGRLSFLAVASYFNRKILVHENNFKQQGYFVQAGLLYKTR